MPIDRFYLEDSLESGRIVALEGEEFHHLSRVMRRKEGEVIELVNGKGALASAEILKMEKRKGFLAILTTSSHQPKLPPLILIQALPKLSCLEWIIQKGTELGASAFHIFPSERSEKKVISAHQKKRLLQIAISAMKQCGRLDLPSLEYTPNMASLSLPEGNAFFGDLRSTKPLPKESPPYLIFIGPGKGFSSDEHCMLEELFQAKGVRLHPYILKAETAAIAALTLAGSL